MMAASTGRTKANCMGTYILLGISLHFILDGTVLSSIHRIASHRIRIFQIDPQRRWALYKNRPLLFFLQQPVGAVVLHSFECTYVCMYVCKVYSTFFSLPNTEVRYLSPVLVSASNSTFSMIHHIHIVLRGRCGKWCVCVCVCVCAVFDRQQ